MRRISRFPNPAAVKATKEQPNWGIQSLYNDRQLIRKKKLTKFFVPYDSVQPDDSWRLYIFNSDISRDDIYKAETPSILIGREDFCDIKLIDKKVGRQHCVIQFRYTRLGEDQKPRIVPYIFDISSRNGTYINGSKIPSMCFVQLQHKDTITFGNAVDSIVLMKIQTEN